MLPRPAPCFALSLLFAGCADDKSRADDTSGDSGAEEGALVTEPVVCASPAVTLEQTEAGYLATTDHYVLEISGFDEEESENLAALAETSWEAFGAFFGVAPDERREVLIAADEAGMNAELSADGISELEGAGGYYDPIGGRAYLYRQPTAYYSRVLLLHELAHQYQDATSYTSGLPFWYVEGVAEALGRHHWDGACLELRVRPLLSWEDAAASARAELELELDLAAILSGGTVSRPLAQEIVRLLSSEPVYAAAFADWREAVAGGASPTDLELFATTIAPVDDVALALPDWVSDDQEPMTPIWLDWVPEGDARARGFAAGSSSAARVKEAVQTFSMVIGAPDSGENVGTVYGFDESTGSVELAFLSADGGVSRFAVVEGAVTWETVGAVTLASELRWTQTADEVTTLLEIGGETVELPRALPAAGGLALYDADAIFDEIHWE